MRTTRKSEIAQLAVVAAIFVAGLLTLLNAPARIPIHWDANGNPNGYGDPIFGLLLAPVLALGLYLLLRWLPMVDPGRANYATFAGPYATLRWAILLLMAVLQVQIVLAVRGIPIDAGILIPVAVGLLFIVLGNLMGKLRPNWFVGIRTPWTLSSKRSWVRTHAVGGRVFIVIGVAFLLVPATRLVGGRASTAIFVPTFLALAGALYLFVYSYLVWRNDPDRIPPAGTLPAETR